MNYISLFLLCFALSASSLIFPQQLEIKLETDKTEYYKNDTIFANYKIKNISNDTIILSDMGRFYVEKHCFAAYIHGENFYNDDKELGDFQTLYPGGEINMIKPLDIYWMCRSAPPREVWKIILQYNLRIKENDNFYTILISDKEKRKIHFRAWKGEVGSNQVILTIK